jgi:hypothetical protein
MGLLRLLMKAGLVKRVGTLKTGRYVLTGPGRVDTDRLPAKTGNLRTAGSGSPLSLKFPAVDPKPQDLTLSGCCLNRRQPPKCLLHHSDRGSLYVDDGSRALRSS